MESDYDMDDWDDHDLEHLNDDWEDPSIDYGGHKPLGQCEDWDYVTNPRAEPS